MRCLLLFVFLLTLLSCKDGKSGGSGGQGSTIIVEDSSEGFPQFQGKDIFLKASLIQVTNFSFEKEKWGMKAKEMFGCMGEKHFVDGTDYCFYFNNIWIQSQISNESGDNTFALNAQAAYSNKIFTDFLFRQAVLTLTGADFVLYSSVVNWQKDKNILVSPKTSSHLMKNRVGDTLKGLNLALDYRTNMMTMEKAELNLAGEIL